MITIPPDVRTSGTAAIVPFKFQCPTCKADLNIDLPYFINLKAWPAFEDIAFESSFSQVHCKRCHKFLPIRFALIVEHPKRNLLIFVTHHADDGNVDAAFKKFFQMICGHLSANAVSLAAKRPYTFVQGYTGLRRLLECLRGTNPKSSLLADLRSDEEKPTIDSLHGYLHGSIFLYYPGQMPVRDIARLLLRLAATAKTHEEARRVRALFEDCLNILGRSHPWLVQEMGRLCLAQGDIAAAREWLNTAVTVQHCWLAVTQHFMDATPTTREDGAPQSAALPHVDVTSTLGSVQAHRHVVTQLLPPTQDYGFWHFPQTADSVIPSQYSLVNLLSTSAILLGEIERELFGSAGQVKRVAGESYAVLLNHVFLIFEHIQPQLSGNSTKLPVLIEAIRSFWRNYLQRRWHLGKLTPTNFKEIRTQLANEVGGWHVFASRLGGLFPFANFNQNLLRLWDGAHRATRWMAAEHDVCLKDPVFTGEGLRAGDGFLAVACERLNAATDTSELILCWYSYTKPLIRMDTEISDREAANAGIDQRKRQRILNELLSFYQKVKKSGRITTGDFAMLNTSWRQLSEVGCSLTSTFTKLLVARIEAVSGPKMSVSHCHWITVEGTCESCSHSATYFIPSIINTSARPDLRQRALNAEFVGIVCYFCKQSLGIGKPFFYCDPKRSEFLIYFPWDDDEAFEEMRIRCEKYLQDIPQEYKAEKQMVAFWNGEFEWPWQNDDEWAILVRIRDPLKLIEIIDEYFITDIEVDLEIGSYGESCEQQAAIESQHGRYELAASLWASAFLACPTRLSPLRALLECLQRLNKPAQSAGIRDGLLSLRRQLRQAHVLYDIRGSKQHTFDVDRLRKIKEEGIPSEWSLGQFEELVGSIAQQRNSDAI